MVKRKKPCGLVEKKQAELLQSGESSLECVVWRSNLFISASNLLFIKGYNGKPSN